MLKYRGGLPLPTDREYWATKEQKLTEEQLTAWAFALERRWKALEKAAANIDHDNRWMIKFMAIAIAIMLFCSGGFAFIGLQIRTIENGQSTEVLIGAEGTKDNSRATLVKDNG